MARYRKLLAAVVGIGVLLGARHGFDLSGHEAEIVDAIIALATLAGVYQVPNA